MELQSNPGLDPEAHYYPRMRLQRSDDGPYHTKAAMCRTREFKYVRRLYETDELYDLRSDPGEQCNRIGDPALRGPLTELKERMLTWYQETADVVPFEIDKRS
jgi:arylsulfatase A-like enzyme